MSDINAELGNETVQGEQVEPAAVEQDAPKQADHSWIPKRLSEITAARRAAEERAQRAEERLARLEAGAVDTTQQQTYQPNQSVDELAKTYAERMVRERQQTETMNSRIQAINEAGAKEFGDDFEKACDNLKMAGVGGTDFLKVLTNVPNAEKLVTYLGKSENLNEAMRITSMDPVQMGIELTKMSTQAAKALSKQISKAPPPSATIDGGGGGDGGEPDPSDTSAWMKWRSGNRKSRR